MAKQVLLVDTRARPKHCRFAAWLVQDLGPPGVAVTKCCPGCLKSLKLTLKLAGFEKLPIVEV
jgi:hypothetical protein